MKYSRFEDLPVWQAAIEFALQVFEFTSKGDFRGLGDTKSQLERASLSISNNIAEGLERGTTTELIHFLYISKGSSGESRSMLRLCERSPQFADLKAEISALIEGAKGISRQLNGWLESLKNTDIKGPKFLDDKSRRRYVEKRERDEFDAEMRQFREALEQKLILREQGVETDLEPPRS
ncbi:MAG TPA: four helix bundle protein [Pyrinomonadaceae bacterium]|nr:four helix bundle protein [Pyrinomonadaceae bacterium]